MKLLVATNNQAKRDEISKTLHEFYPSIECVFPETIGITDDVEETGATFEENAGIKAHFFGEKSGFLTLADDGGIAIDTLQGAPGVHSKRWLGHDATDEEMIAYTLEKMKDVPEKERTAHMVVCEYLYDPVTKNDFFVTEKIDGKVAFAPSSKGIPHFPYRSLLIVDRFQKYYDELSKEEHTLVNHRRIALGKIAPIIASYAQH